MNLISNRRGYLKGRAGPCICKCSLIHWSLWDLNAIWISNFQANFNDGRLEYLLWNCLQINVSGPYWWQVNIGADIALVLAISSTNGNPFYQRMYTSQDLNISWWRHPLETFSALLAICAGNSPATGEFPAQRPVTRSFNVFFDLCLNKRLNTHSWGWWVETPMRSLWRHSNVIACLKGCFTDAGAISIASESWIICVKQACVKPQLKTISL